MMVWPHISFQPLISPIFLWLLALAFLAFAIFWGWQVLRRQSQLKFGLYLIACVPLLALLSGPVISQTITQNVRPKIIIAIDDSESMRLSGRTIGAQNGLARLKEKFASAFDIAEVHFDEKGLLPALSNLANISDASAALIISDGAAPDAPIKGADGRAENWPFSSEMSVHQLMVADQNENDQRLEIIDAPAYLTIGQKAHITLKIHQRGPQTVARLIIGQTGGAQEDGRDVPANAPIDIEIVPTERGPMDFHFSVVPRPGETSLANNDQIIRLVAEPVALKVLLVSGRPHTGTRAWRNLLKSDPSVGLIHFTILRPPSAIDDTPTDDMALIPFPVDALFLERLNDFDLVVFDRFEDLEAFDGRYLLALGQWLEQGGALFVAAGGADSRGKGLTSGPLAPIMPVTMLGQTRHGLFRPSIVGHHPIIAQWGSAFAAGSAAGSAAGQSIGAEKGENGPLNWGRWLSYEAAQLKPEAVQSGAQILMTAGADPLLIISHIGTGRMALLLSDNAFMWQRGFDGGGPFAALFRRTAHWLIKEPSLEEGQFSLHVDSSHILVRGPLNREKWPDLVVKGPNGFSAPLPTATIPTTKVQNPINDGGEVSVPIMGQNGMGPNGRENQVPLGIYRLEAAHAVGSEIIGWPDPLIVRGGINHISEADSAPKPANQLYGDIHYIGRDGKNVPPNLAINNLVQRHIIETGLRPILPNWAWGFLVMLPLMAAWAAPLWHRSGAAKTA